MELRFKPQFKRDYQNLRNKKVKELLAGHIRQISRAENIFQIGQLTPLEKYESRYKIKIKINQKETYRVGLEIRKNAVWFERVLLRPAFYKHYRR